jgi:hypothetical protein
MATAFEVAKTIQGLLVYRRKPNFEIRVSNSNRDLVRRILSGNIRSGIVGHPYGDEKTGEEYRKGLPQPLEAIDRNIVCRGLAVSIDAPQRRRRDEGPPSVSSAPSMAH